MGFRYAIDSFVLIVAEHGPVCLEEIEEINSKTYHANFNGELSDVLKTIHNYSIELKDRKYCLKPGTDIEKIKNDCRFTISWGYSAHNYVPSFCRKEEVLRINLD